MTIQQNRISRENIEVPLNFLGKFEKRLCNSAHFAFIKLCFMIYVSKSNL